MVLARLARGVGVQVISAGHVAVTVLVIVATANHFLLDAIAAIPFVLVSVAVIDRRRAPATVRSADAFFLHVETAAAPQHVGGMVVLARTGSGTPTVDEMRALIRAELPNMPRFRRRPECRAPSRRWRWVDVDPDQMDWDWHVSEQTALAASRIDDIDSRWHGVLSKNFCPARLAKLFTVHGDFALSSWMPIGP